VDRRSKQGALDDRAPLEGPGERVALEPLEPCVEADVHRWRVLRLDPADPLERFGHRHPPGLEQQLACQQRAVQLALTENSLRRRHRRSLRALVTC
jgi:hypothetical protein